MDSSIQSIGTSFEKTKGYIVDSFLEENGIILRAKEDLVVDHSAMKVPFLN